MVPFRGFDAEGDFPADLAEFFPDGFHLLRSRHFIHCRPARRNKQEDAPHARLHFFHQLYKVVELTQSAPGNGGVDLEVHARLLGHFRRAEGPFIRVRHAPEGVMRGFMGAVQAQGHALHPRLFQRMKVRVHQPGRGGRAQGHMQPLVRRRADQFQNIRPHDGVPSRQHEHGRPEFRQPINQPQGFFMVQFIRMRTRLGHGPAMFARKGASARHLPENQKGTFIEICFTKSRSHSSGLPL